jgi:ankyrin repeat protein
VVELFLSKISKDSVDLIGPNSTTALIWAAVKGHEDIVKLLLENGAAASFGDRYGSTALHHAAANGFTGVIDVLIHGGAKIESDNHKNARPLQVATQFGQSEAAETLLSLGADPNATGPNWWPALHQAASRGHINVINVLLSRNADIEKRGQYNKTALIWAGEIGQSGSVRCLVGHGANFNAQDQFGETALHYASANGHTEVVRVLTSKGADPGIANTRFRRPLHGAASEFGGVYPTSKILLEHGANPSDKDEAGCTPLHYAAKSGNERLVRLLLHYGADWQATNRNGELAVALAEKNGHGDIAKVLREDRHITKIRRGAEPGGYQ